MLVATARRTGGVLVRPTKSRCGRHQSVDHHEGVVAVRGMGVQMRAIASENGSYSSSIEQPHFAENGSRPSSEVEDSRSRYWDLIKKKSTSAVTWGDSVLQPGEVVYGHVVNVSGRGASVCIPLDENEVIRGFVFTRDLTLDIQSATSFMNKVRQADYMHDALGAPTIQVGDGYEMKVVGRKGDGTPVLSIRGRALDLSKRRLRQLKEESTALYMELKRATKGGFIGNIEGIDAFLPFGEVPLDLKKETPEETSEAMIGESVPVTVIEVPESNTTVVSLRKGRQSLLKQSLHVGQLHKCLVTSVQAHAIYCHIVGSRDVVGKISPGMLSWSLGRYCRQPEDLLKKGDEIYAVVNELQHRTNKKGQKYLRLNLSTRVLERYRGEILNDVQSVMADPQDRYAEYLERATDNGVQFVEHEAYPKGDCLEQQ